MLLDYIGRWLDDRLGVGDVLGRLLTKPLRGGARYMFSLGFVNLFLFVNQVITGMLLMLYYVPSPDHAYDTVKFIQDGVPFGYMIRGLHYWGANFMVVTVMLHAVRVFVFGAYKKPRELMWLTGAALLLLVFGFAFTGYLLPWDQKAYWATVVGTSVPGTAPVFGHMITSVMRGGTEVGALTLTRFFTLHTMVLPWTLAGIIGMHLTITQLVGHTSPWDPVKAAKTAPFFPDQVFKDAVMMLAAFAGMAFLATVAPEELETLADPTDHHYIPRPEWYFYFLFQILHYFEGPLEVVGTVILPNVFIAVLLMLPFIDRGPETDPAKRPRAMGALATVILGYVALTVLAALAAPAEHGPAPSAPPAPAAAGAPSGTTSSSTPAPGPATGSGVAATPAAGAVLAPKEKPAPAADVSTGKRLYGELGCSGCHNLGGQGGKVGPPLEGVGTRRDRAWIKGHFREPSKFSPGSTMPPFAQLPDRDLDALTDYMMSLR
ncbi:MAG: cytochrome b N-terminal domain-containing protein [Nitrospirae bacterium]|nr:cytochrome b N-terminal domain-containing protein [Nitrospirota bacterium]